MNYVDECGTLLYCRPLMIRVNQDPLVAAIPPLCTFCESLSTHSSRRIPSLLCFYRGGVVRPLLGSQFRKLLSSSLQKPPAPPSPPPPVFWADALRPLIGARRGGGGGGAARGISNGVHFITRHARTNRNYYRVMAAL